MKHRIRLCIYPRMPELREFPADARDFDCGKAYASRVGTAELDLTAWTAGDLQSAFLWVKEHVPHGMTSGLVCYAFVDQGHGAEIPDPATIMRALGCDVSTSGISRDKIMVTGVYLPGSA